MPSRTHTPPQLKAIHVYPVKSVRALSPVEVAVEPWGLAQDRRWMLVCASGRFVTQREQPRLALVSATPLPRGGLRLEAPGAAALEVPEPGTAGGATPIPAAMTVQIFSDRMDAVPAGDAADAWFSGYLGTAVRLVHLADPAHARPIDPEYGLPGETVSLADGYPLLLTTTASLTALNDFIAEDALSAGSAEPAERLPMNRFRPNVVIDGTPPWAEDDWRRVRIGEVAFRVVKPCGRCVITTTDQETARRGTEPLRALARHRRIGKLLAFGQNLVPENTGVLRVGDPLTVLD